MKTLRFQETGKRSHRRPQGRFQYAWTMWTIGGYRNEVPTRGEWLEQIEAPTRQKRGEEEDMAGAGCDLMPTDAHDILARNLSQMRTKGPVIEMIAWMVL